MLCVALSPQIVASEAVDSFTVITPGNQYIWQYMAKC